MIKTLKFFTSNSELDFDIWSLQLKRTLFLHQIIKSWCILQYIQEILFDFFLNFKQKFHFL